MKLTNSDVAYEFSGLSPTERRYLEQWQRAARAVGISGVAGGETQRAVGGRM